MKFTILQITNLKNIMYVCTLVPWYVHLVMYNFYPCCFDTKSYRHNGHLVSNRKSSLKNQRRNKICEND